MVETQTISHAQDGVSKRAVSSIAILTALVSFTMLFATLMLGFVIYRLTAPVWPPQGMKRPDLVLPMLSTLTIAISSFCFFKFEEAMRAKKLQLNLLQGALAFGILFMVIQGIFWNSLKSQGIFVSSGLYPSIIYAFTWIHAAHVVAAYFMLGWLYLKVSKPGVLESDSDLALMRVENVGKFWHFLGIIWVIMFVTIFIL